MDAETAELRRSFLDYLSQERGLAEATIRAYGEDLRSLAHYAAGAGVNDPLDDPTPRAVSRYLAWERARGVADSTLRRRLCTLRVWTAYLELEGRRRGTAGALPLPGKRPALPRALGVDQVEALLGATRKRLEQAAATDGHRALTALVVLRLSGEFGLTTAEIAHLPADTASLDPGNPLNADLELAEAWSVLTQAVSAPGGDGVRILPSPAAQSRLRRDFTTTTARLTARLLPQRLEYQRAFEAGPPRAPHYLRALRDCALLELLYAAGLRVGEALGLNWRDLDLEDGFVRLRGKGGRRRVVPFGESARLSLRRLRADLAASAGDPVFVGPRGRPLQRRAVNTLLSKLSADCGLDPPATPHQLRHSFATHLLAGGAGIRLVNELLGHRRLAETQRYTRVEVSRLVKAHQRHPREVTEHGFGP